MSRTLQSEKIGPVDVAVIAFEGSDFDTGVTPVLTELQKSGTVHVIDLAFVRKDADGNTSIVELADECVSDAFDQITDSQFDLLSEADLTDIASGLQPSSSAMVVVWENCWATRFASAIRETHGRVAMLERIPRDNVERAITALGELIRPSHTSRDLGLLTGMPEWSPCSRHLTREVTRRATATGGSRKAPTKWPVACTGSRCLCRSTGCARSTPTRSRSTAA